MPPMSEPLRKVRIKHVTGPIGGGTYRVLLGDESKTFAMFIGPGEGAALVRELNEESPPRPMTHDLLGYVLSGFDIKVKQVVISDIVNNVFCATLVLEQRCVDGREEWTGKRNEVRIDARPSDCLVLALKEKVDLWATASVLERVPDAGEQAGLPGKPPLPQGLKELDLSGMQDEVEQDLDDMFGRAGDDE